ncbi:MAG: RHS repeat protein [Candidatus Sumerlaeia bacterium]|nr:RHS repeat protein [Candidatus Sumerlaeia bacterium]
MQLSIKSLLCLCPLALLVSGFSPPEFLPGIEGDDCPNHNVPPESLFQYNSLNGPLPGDPGGLHAPRFVGSAPQEGDPIAISHATVFRHEVDLSLPAHGQLFFGVRRTYDEDDAGASAGPDIRVGTNWRLSLDVRLFQAGDDLVLRDERGRLRFFHPDTDYQTGDVRYYSQLDQGLYAYATRNGTSTFEVTFNGGMVYRFAQSSGRLERITDRNGNFLTFSYDGNGRLTTVGNSADSRQISLEYVSSGAAAGHLHRVSDPQGVAATYEYTTVSNPFAPSSPFVALSRVTLRGGAVTNYEYTTFHSAGGPSDVFQRLRLDRVLDGSNQVIVDYAYVSDTQNANFPRPEIRGTGNQVLVDYISSVSGFYGQVYDVAESGGTVRREYSQTWARDLLQLIEDEELILDLAYVGCGGNPGDQSSQRLLASSTNWVTGETWEFTYDLVPNSAPPAYSGYSTPADHFRQGNLTRIDYDDGDYETFTYGGGILNHLTSWRNREGGWTHYTYGSNGNVSRIDHPDGSFTVFWYDQYGNLTMQETFDGH